MVSRICRIALGLCLLTVVSGCIEMTQTITLNPDGKGKMKVEILVPAFDFDMSGLMGGPKEKKEKSLDDLRQEAINGFIKKSPGVTAWKDVAVKWSRDGRVHMTGTLYFERLEDLDAPAQGKDPGKVDPGNTFGGSFKVVKGADGTLKILGKNPGIKEGLMKMNTKGADNADISKLSDKELDEELLTFRVKYQSAKPFFAMMFGDLKLKTVFHLPGEVVEAKGFKKDGAGTASMSLDGNELLAMMKKFVMLDGAAVRKLATSTNQLKDWTALIGPAEFFVDPTLTVNKIDRPLFDYQQEVREARAGYPALRKSLNLDDATPLPGEAK